MYDARLFTDKLPPNIVDALKDFSGNDCYLIKRDVDRKSLLSNKNNCHINVQRYVEKFGGERLNGAVYSIKVYDRDFTADEVLNNYNAQKSRYGLT
jgi:hypothetical protein